MVKKPDNPLKIKNYTTPSSREAIKNLSEAVINDIKKNLPEMSFPKIELVLSEALSNALFYGSFQILVDLKPDEKDDDFWEIVEERENDKTFYSREISLRMEYSEDELRFEIKDHGNGFDWKSFFKPINSNKNQKGIDDPFLKCHGRGLAIIRHYSDALSWNKKGNEIRFLFKTPKD